MDSKKFVMSYSGGKDCMLAMYRKIKEGWTPVALITTVKKDSVDSWTHSISKKLLEKASQSLNIPIIYDFDLGHVSPRMTIINGAIAKVHYKNHKATIEFELK